MRNNTIIRQIGGGKDRNGQHFVAVTITGKFQKGQIHWILFKGVNAAITQHSKQLKELDGRVTFLLPSQQVVFNQDEVERALYRLQHNWLVKFQAQLRGIRLQLHYEDQSDFEATHAKRQKPVYVPKEWAYEQV